MTKDQANQFFTPASETKKIAGQFIVWKETRGNTFANFSTDNETVYRVAAAAKKQKDVIISDTYIRIPVYKAFIVSAEIAAKWPRYSDGSATMRITHDELMEVLESMVQL